MRSDGRAFTLEEQLKLVELCRKGNEALTQMQKRCLGDLL